MRESLHAPAVRYPYGRSLVVARTLVVLALAGMACLSVWLLSHGRQPDLAMRAWVGAVAWVLGMAAAWRFWHRLPEGFLVWDGSLWWLETGRTGMRVPVDQSPAVHLDFQTILMLSVQGASHTRQWLWMECRSDPLQWPALRRAVYSRARGGSLAGAPAKQTTDGMPPPQGGGASHKT